MPHLVFRYFNDGKHPNPWLKTLVHPNSVLPADNGKSVHWKLGADEEVWVWVMGEHHLDKPYDTLCDEIRAQRARLKSGQEVRELRYEPAGPWGTGQAPHNGAARPLALRPCGGPGGT